MSKCAALICLLFTISSINALLPLYTSDQIDQIGAFIWQNECASKTALLTHWNDGEPCASCGIGHFLWYPKTDIKPFQETFIDLLAFLEQQSITLPTWLAHDRSCPWPTKQSFDAAYNSPAMQELRIVLANTIRQQAQFIIAQTEQQLHHILNQSSDIERTHIRAQIEHITKTVPGCIAVIDYLNFKGDGTHPSESYQGYRWGLKQVLLAMQTKSPTIQDFVTSAKRILTERVAYAPAEAREQRWLRGWYNRLDRYLHIQ